MLDQKNDKVDINDDVELEQYIRGIYGRSIKKTIIESEGSLDFE